MLYWQNVIKAKICRSVKKKIRLGKTTLLSYLGEELLGNMLLSKTELGKMFPGNLLPRRTWTRQMILGNMLLGETELGKM